jgi:heme A synthase
MPSADSSGHNTAGRGRAAAARFAWATLCVNVAVVLWGAYVRATGSGAGCGNKWPLCGGPIVGASARTQTLIEFTHRATSGVALVMVAALVVLCWRVTVRGDLARYASVLAAVFLANEALLGAALVLLDHVAQDKSSGRVVFLCLHFGNTLLLLATLALTASWLSKGRNLAVSHSLPSMAAVIGGLLATMFIGVTGAVAALGDTLFPATSVRASIAQDFSPAAPALLHFRLMHPVVAVIAGCYVLWVILRSAGAGSGLTRIARAFVVLLFAQAGLGVLNVLLLTPVWLQIVHLLVGDVLWILLVLASSDLVLAPAERTRTVVRTSAGSYV